MSKIITISKRTGYIMAATALLVIILLWFATAREGHRLLDADRPGNTHPTPYGSQ
jgi:hypothetical protein